MTSRRKITLASLMISAIVLSGCSWETDLYNLFVNKDGTMEKCESMSYIIINHASNKTNSDSSQSEPDSAPNTKNACCCRGSNGEIDYTCSLFTDVCQPATVKECKPFEESFIYDLCPLTYNSCNKKSDIKFCESKVNIQCGEGAIVCKKESQGEKDTDSDITSCITPASPDSCGATCENPEGKKCEARQSCRDMCETAGDCKENETRYECGCPGELIDIDNKCVNIQNDRNYCGKTIESAIPCDENHLCLDGECKCPGKLIDKDGQCVDILSNEKYCGKTEDSVTECQGTQSCEDGECKCPGNSFFCDGNCVTLSQEYCGNLAECAEKKPENCDEKGKQGSRIYYCLADENGNHACTAIACKENEERLCNRKCLSKTDENNCGGCGIKCSEQNKPNANAECINDVCIFTCDEGLKNCGTPEEPICVDTDTDVNHCGEKCEQCQSGSRCNRGKCETSCNTTECFDTSKNACVKQTENNSNACGKYCIKCNSEQKCDKGACILKENCAPGTHVNKDQYDSQYCEPNTPKACATTGLNATINDCTAIENTADAICNESGKCVVISCNAHYHLSNNKCIADSTNACGTESVDCTKLKGWDKGSCENGYCKATSCKSGYQLDNGKCLSNVKECGKPSQDCTSIQGWNDGVCENEMCVATKCNEGYHFYDNSCELNDTEHCYSHENNCTTQAGWGAGTCKDGSCYAQYCSSNFQLINGKCECSNGYQLKDGHCIKTDYACSNNKDCQNIEGVMNADCSSGKCQITSCRNGYKQMDNRCKKLDTSNCGGRNCEQIPGWINTYCFNNQCRAENCAKDYQHTNDICIYINNNPDNCGQKDYKCSSHVSGWKKGICTNEGICDASECNDGFHIYNNSNNIHICEANDNNNCGSHGQTCTTPKNCTSKGECK